jgi:hypothetical protein
MLGGLIPDSSDYAALLAHPARDHGGQENRRRERRSG